MQVAKTAARQKTRETGLQDLCVSCRFANVCVFCGPGREPVKSCSGYMATDRDRRHLETGADTEAAGLCVSCTIHKECQKDRPMSGVWHCEDYC
jgi:hypothetical protein